jgi:hypothetical protein
MKALRVHPLCLIRHGIAENIPDHVSAKLAIEYPHDRATGYALGRIRGAGPHQAAGRSRSVIFRQLFDSDTATFNLYLPMPARIGEAVSANLHGGKTDG